ncbi:hypothetical protein [Paramicrobacterium agarici]|uniref:hypothetical protein n=1 Tax=Paramicrobacterium agarici TaxID=630514 RepID=UPI00114E4269|nr:hypothetical protein [Microbacterium agarici]TQO21240.1 hypothetical protein FB385_0037 [Microbacterium agarici]
MRVGRVIGVLVLSVAVGAGLWLIGLDAPFAVTFGLLPPVIALLWECRADNDPLPWEPTEPTSVTGARHDIVRLAWSLRATDGRVGDAALKRVRAIAAHRLQAHGLDLSDPADAPAIIALIGDHAYGVVAPSSLRRPDRSEIDPALSRLSAPVSKENT